MPKAVPLTPEALLVTQPAPKAATPARSFAKPSPSTNQPKPDQIPLQIRLPRDEVRAIKVAAAERDQTISEFMLACFHAYMKDGKHEK